MNEIICPNCKKAFKVDEAGFADILKQVRDHQFEEELQERLTSAVKLAEANTRIALQAELTEKDKELTDLKAKSISELAKLLADKEAEISTANSKIQNAEIVKQLEVSQAVKTIEKERDRFANELKIQKTETQLLEKSIKEQFTNKLIIKNETIKMKDDEIARLKDFKQKLSTKMVGETLEQHCETEFNKLRATAFQNAYFEKDNDARNGNKGDFIYKETDAAAMKSYPLCSK